MAGSTTAACPVAATEPVEVGDAHPGAASVVFVYFEGLHVLVVPIDITPMTGRPTVAIGQSLKIAILG